MGLRSRFRGRVNRFQSTQLCQEQLIEQQLDFLPQSQGRARLLRRHVETSSCKKLEQ